MQVITISAQRTTEAEARAAQKEAENIVNVIAFDEIRKLPQPRLVTNDDRWTSLPLHGYEPRPSEIRVNCAAARSVRNARSTTLRTSRSTCAAMRTVTPGRDGITPGREGTDSRNGAMLLR